MKTVTATSHSRFSLNLVLTSVMAIAILFGSATTSFADKTKKVSTKPTSAKDKRAAAVLKYGTPITGAVEALSAAERSAKSTSTSTSNKTPRTQNGADSSQRESRIVSVRASSDVFAVRLELSDDEQTIDVGIYNMLGKKVHDVYRGYASRGMHDYSVPISDLPEGVYICIAQGSGFRRAEKFYLSR
jgi:hypothetical protein